MLLHDCVSFGKTVLYYLTRHLFCDSLQFEAKTIEDIIKACLKAGFVIVSFEVSRSLMVVYFSQFHPQLNLKTGHGFANMINFKLYDKIV